MLSYLSLLLFLFFISFGLNRFFRGFGGFIPERSKNRLQSIFILWGYSYMANPLKSRWWWFIAYPDSLPDEWIDKLLLTGIPFIVSPLHDRDINSEGDYKKPHYHIIVIFDNPTTYNHVLNHCCKPLNATIPQVILNLSGSVAYLTHKGLDNKAQYQSSDICCFNGSQIYLKDDEYLSDVYSAIESIIRDKHPFNMLALIDACEGITDALSIIRSRPFYFAQLLK